jgi:hypothetical protein
MSERKVSGQVKQKEHTKIVGVRPEDLGAVPGQRVIRIEYVDLDSLSDHRAEKNAKRHRLDELDASMRRHGYAAPIMVDEGTQRIVAGHGRVDTLITRRAAGREAPDGVHVRDGKWLVPVVRGIAFKDSTEAMSYLLADNQIQMLAGYDWHELNEIAKVVAESPEGLVGTGFVDLKEIEAQMEREVQGVLDQEPDDPGSLPEDDEDSNEGIDGKSDVMFKFGQHSFTVSRDKWIKWLDDIRLSGGFDKESIVSTVRERLGL